MLILITLLFFIIKFLTLGVIGLFFFEDLELTSSANGAIYATYVALASVCFLSLLFYFLGRKLLWLIIFGLTGFFYLTMYNLAPDISDIHRSNNLKSRYFENTTTFIERMVDVVNIVSEKLN